MNIAVITARGGSTRCPGKHTAVIGGKKLIEWPLDAALNAKTIGWRNVWLATDDVELIGIADRKGAQVLQLTPGLCSDTASQADALRWAVTTLDGQLREVENVVGLLGNTAMIDSTAIDDALTLLDLRPEIDSVMTVWKAEDDHPFRAMKVNEEGFLRSVLADAPEISNVQVYPDVFYHDQGLWAFRKDCIYAQEGPPPWTWCGRKCVPIVRPWCVGRDVDVAADLGVQEDWLRRMQSSE